MKILQLCKKFPFPKKDGETIAITTMAKALHELGCDVSLLAMNTRKHWIDTKEHGKELEHYTKITSIEIDNRIKVIPALQNLFSNSSYHIERFINVDFENALIDLLQNTWFDVVQLETLYLAPYIPIIRKHSSALIVMRSHNVEHEIWERIAKNESFLQRTYLNTITPRLKSYEIEQLNTYDLLLAITERDEKQFRSFGMKKPSIVTPIGLDCREYGANDNSFYQPLSLSFIGSLDWMPNLEGLKWFLEAVWQPFLSKKFPDLKFHIAGRNPPNWLKNLSQPNVIVHGEVPDAATFINEHSVMVVPLLSGSGMRAKILEAMTLGKVVISSSVGMEGIEIEKNQEALLADTPQDYVNQIEWCYQNSEMLLQIGQRAQVFCAKNYDNLEVAKVYLNKLRKMKGVKGHLTHSI
jgi:polysaccharide biosynthesis protein PslH